MKRSTWEASLPSFGNGHQAGGAADLEADADAGATVESRDVTAQALESGQAAAADAPPLPPMPFPGPFAHVPAPAVATGEDAEPRRRAAYPSSGDTGTRTSDQPAEPEIDQLSFLPLTYAAARGNLEQVRALLDAGALVNLADVWHGCTTALIEAVKAQNDDVVDLLSRQPGIDLDRKDSKGHSALFFAYLAERLDIMDRLLDAGAEINLQQGKDGNTVLILAAAAGRVDVAALLLKRQDIAPDNRNLNDHNALISAAYHDRPEIVLCLLEAGAQVNLCYGEARFTALILAAKHGRTDVVRHMLARPDLELDKRESTDRTALMTAAYFGKAETAALLLAAGASRSAVDGRHGCTALEIAMWVENAGVVEVFLAHGEELDDRDVRAHGYSPDAYSITVADLYAARTPSRFAATAAGLGQDFFSELIQDLGADESGKKMLKRLRKQGMSSACAHVVKSELSGPHAPWRVKNTGARQAMAYCLGVLSGLHRQHVRERVQQPYLEAGVSAAAVDRQSRIAVAQLEGFADLAARTLARIGGDNLDALVDGCMKSMDIYGQPDVDALKATQRDAGFCAPVAAAIATSWQAAVKAVEPDTMTLSPGMTLQAVMALCRNHIAERAPLLFAQEMLRQIGSRERLSDLQALLDDDGLHLLFQIQCDQLRQYCIQMPNSSESTLNTSSTSSTSSTMSTLQKLSHEPAQQ